jgi:hypothetical protein
MRHLLAYRSSCVPLAFVAFLCIGVGCDSSEDGASAGDDATIPDGHAFDAGDVECDVVVSDGERHCPGPEGACCPMLGQPYDDVDACLEPLMLVECGVNPNFVPGEGTECPTPPAVTACYTRESAEGQEAWFAPNPWVAADLEEQGFQECYPHH